MAYYSGQASSYQELLTVLVSACVEQGWTWADGILSKDSAFIKFEVSTADISGKGSGLILQGGTGKIGSTLIEPSPVTPRLGRVGAATAIVNFPIAYNIHINNNPDEVYLIVNFDVDRFYYLAFGVSSVQLQGTGLWISASSPLRYGLGTNVLLQGWAMSPNSGGSNIYNYVSGFFWSTITVSSDSARQEAMHTGFNNKGWNVPGPNMDGIEAISQAIPFISRSPDNWSSNPILLPIRIFNTVASSKQSIIAEIANARYLRIDNYEPNQIVGIGDEQWKIYPFHQKNINERNGSNSTSSGRMHTGTFGWAIRYDGP